MSDAELAELRRAYAASRDDWDRYRLRVALVRAGRRGEAGFEAGDLVRVDWHVNASPILRSRPDGWRLVDAALDFYRERRIRWRVTRPAPPVDGCDVLERRDIFDELDILTLIEPAPPL